MQTKRHNFAFTMIEMMTVITIIVLVLGLAVPVVHSLEGNRSLEAGYNRISAALGHARQIALYNRAPAGVVFFPENYIDATGVMHLTGRQNIGYVMQEKNIIGMPLKNIPDDATFTPTDDRYFDLIPGEETITLPPGLGIQVVIGQDQLPASGAGINRDKYLRVGIVLFDENGQLTNSTQYWIRGNSKLGILLGLLQGAALQYSGLMPPYTPQNTTLILNNTQYPTPLTLTESVLYSQCAICLYDSVAYGQQVNPNSGKSFADVDNTSTNNIFDSISTYGYGGPSGYFINKGFPSNSATGDKLAEQTWLDANGEMLVVKPNDGSLLRNK